MLLRCCFAVCLGFVTPVALAAQAPVQRQLSELRQAHGGNHWDGVGGLTAQGRENSEGLDAAWRTAVDLRNGQFATHARNAVFASADGADAQGRWHQDISGAVHPQDSAEARATAATDRWLRRFGAITAPDQARYRILPPSMEGTRRFDRLEATPAGGHPVILWIDAATHRLDRAIWPSSFERVTRRYGDYRAVDGLWLPFRIEESAATLAGTADHSLLDTVARYRLLPQLPADALARPDPRVRDVTMHDGATQATTPLSVHGGVLLVQARINGSAPLPFILDTGGHAILSEDAARRLSLTSQGKGVSTGSGPGSMRTAYTRVARLDLGQAQVRDQPFLVMPLGYATTDRGSRTPITGILGLEVFERFAVTLDYDHGRLLLQPFDHGEAPALPAGDAVPLVFTDDMPLAAGAVDGKDGIFGIDTGNGSYLLLFPQWAERVGVLAHYAAGFPMPTGGVGGLFVSHVVHVRSMRLGATAIDPPLAQLTRVDAGATGNPTEAGNIGQDVLSHYRVHFDYRRQRMVLSPRATLPPRQFATAGLAAIKPDAAHADRLVVLSVVPDGPAARAGLKKGDAIAAIDGTPVRNLGSTDARDALNARPDGTVVVLTLADHRSLRLVLHDLAPR